MVVSLDAFSEAVRIGVEQFSDVTFHLHLKSTLRSVSGGCGAHVELEPHEQGGRVHLRITDDHGVVGEIEREIAPWEEPKTVLETVDGMLESCGLELDEDE